MKSIKQINNSLYKASLHLVEAGKYLSDTGFKEQATNVMVMADMIVSVIQPEKEKMSEERMDDILKEIMKHGN